MKSAVLKTRSAGAQKHSPGSGPGAAVMQTSHWPTSLPRWTGADGLPTGTGIRAVPPFTSRSWNRSAD